MEIGATGPLMGDPMSVNFWLDWKGSIRTGQDWNRKRQKRWLAKIFLFPTILCHPPLLHPTCFHSFPPAATPSNQLAPHHPTKIKSSIVISNVCLKSVSFLWNPIKLQWISRHSVFKLMNCYNLLWWKSLKMLFRRTSAGSSGQSSAPQRRSPRAPPTPLTTPSYLPSPEPLR